jgi:hypothetical protein
LGYKKAGYWQLLVLSEEALDNASYFRIAKQTSANLFELRIYLLSQPLKNPVMHNGQ